MTIAGGGLMALLTLVAMTLFAPAEAQQQVDLTPALLTLADLPAGWQPYEDEFGDLGLDDLSMPDPADFALDDLGIDPNGPCARALAPVVALAFSPPLSQAETMFQRGTLGPFLFHGVALLPPGAAESYLALNDASTVQEVIDTCLPELVAQFAEDDELGFGTFLQNLGLSFRATPLTLEPVGDQTAGMRLDMTFGIVGTSVLLASSRRGDAVSTIALIVDPLTANTSQPLLDGLLRRADTKLAGVLAGR